MTDHSIEYSSPTADDKLNAVRQTALYSAGALFPPGHGDVDELLAAARKIADFVTNG